MTTLDRAARDRLARGAKDSDPLVGSLAMDVLTLLTQVDRLEAALTQATDALRSIHDRLARESKRPAKDALPWSALAQATTLARDALDMLGGDDGD